MKKQTRFQLEHTHIHTCMQIQFENEKQQKKIIRGKKTTNGKPGTDRIYLFRFSLFLSLTLFILFRYFLFLCFFSNFTIIIIIVKFNIYITMQQNLTCNNFKKQKISGQTLDYKHAPTYTHIYDL